MSKVNRKIAKPIDFSYQLQYYLGQQSGYAVAHTGHKLTYKQPQNPPKIRQETWY